MWRWWSPARRGSDVPIASQVAQQLRAQRELHVEEGRKLRAPRLLTMVATLMMPVSVVYALVFWFLDMHAPIGSATLSVFISMTVLLLQRLQWPTAAKLVSVAGWYLNLAIMDMVLTADSGVPVFSLGER